MATTFRADWADLDANQFGNVIDVSFHDSDLSAARAKARAMSKRHGSAFVIKSVDGKDVAQLGHTDGRADPHGWDAG